MFGLDLDKVTDMASGFFGIAPAVTALTDLLENNEQIKTILSAVGVESVSDLLQKLPMESLPQLMEMAKDGLDANEIIAFIQQHLNK